MRHGYDPLASKWVFLVESTALNIKKATRRKTWGGSEGEREGVEDV